MNGSTLLNTEINTLIKLMREDYLATKINVESELISYMNLELLIKDYTAIKNKLEALRPKEDTNAKIHPDPKGLLNS